MIDLNRKVTFSFVPLRGGFIEALRGRITFSGVQRKYSYDNLTFYTLDELIVSISCFSANFARVATGSPDPSTETTWSN